MKLTVDIDHRLETLLGGSVSSKQPLAGGCIGDVYRIVLKNGANYVLKMNAGPTPRLDIEAFMLRYLAEHSDLPVPKVVASEPELLVMEDLPGESRFDAASQEHAAELVAALHQNSAERFGLERDTLIGGLHQPNPWTDSWLDFFREQRILHMAVLAQESGSLPQGMLKRLDRFCERLDEWLDEPEYPALLHGDLWTTNILAKDGRVTGFLDPAVYYGHPEIELAFSTLFGTFGEPFFKCYSEINRLEEGFFELRRDLYNLYPLLVHVRLFGAGYAQSVDRILKRVGL